MLPLFRCSLERGVDVTLLWPGRGGIIGRNVCRRRRGTAFGFLGGLPRAFAGQHFMLMDQLLLANCYFFSRLRQRDVFLCKLLPGPELPHHGPRGAFLSLRLAGCGWSGCMAGSFMLIEQFLDHAAGIASGTNELLLRCIQFLLVDFQRRLRKVQVFFQRQLALLVGLGDELLLTGYVLLFCLDLVFERLHRRQQRTRCRGDHRAMLGRVAERCSKVQIHLVIGDTHRPLPELFLFRSGSQPRQSLRAQQGLFVDEIGGGGFRFDCLSSWRWADPVAHDHCSNYGQPCEQEEARQDSPTKGFLRHCAQIVVWRLHHYAGSRTLVSDREHTPLLATPLSANSSIEMVSADSPVETKEETVWRKWLPAEMLVSIVTL